MLECRWGDAFAGFPRVVHVFSRFWHVRRPAPSPPRAAPEAAFEALNYDENADSDQDNDFDDIPAFVLDEEAEGQDALADFDVGATFAPNYGHNGHDCRKEGDREHAEHDFSPCLRNWLHDIDTATPAQWFFHFFPIQFLSTDVLNATNAQNPDLNLTLPLLMNYLTARLIISCHVGLPLDIFWG